jgi:hypothetical protein
MSATVRDSPKKATFGTSAEELFVRHLPAPAARFLIRSPAAVPQPAS